MVVVQSWLLYRRDRFSTGKEKKSWLLLKNFKMSIAESLLRAVKAGVSKRGRPPSLNAAVKVKKSRGPTFPIPNKSIRLDGVHHWTEYGKKNRYKFPGCTGYTK